MPRAPPAPKRQATLHDMGKVVSSRAFSYYNVSSEDVDRYKATLEDADTTKEEFMTALRHLSSMLMTRDLLTSSMIGKVVSRLRRKHPDEEVRKLAGSMVDKWKLEVIRQVDVDRRVERRSRGDVRTFIEAGRGGRDTDDEAMHLRAASTHDRMKRGEPRTNAPPWGGTRDV